MLSFSIAYADCDWKTIKDNGDDTFTYSKQCHLAVGRLVKSSALKDDQITDLYKTIQLKDLALQQSESRANMWMDTSVKLTETLNHYESLRQNTGLLYYTAGIATVVLSAYVMGQFHH